MPWPIPPRSKITYPKPISWAVWVPILLAIASVVAGAVLLLWPRGTPTQTSEFWVRLIGAPVAACALVGGIRLNCWERKQTRAEEDEREQQRISGLWRDWTRRHLRIVEVAAFVPCTKQIAALADEKSGLPTLKERSIEFEQTGDGSDASRREALLQRVVARFADALRLQRDVAVTLMLDDSCVEHAGAWSSEAQRIFSSAIPNATFQVETHTATGTAQWLTAQVDQISRVTRLVIAAQLWAEKDIGHRFSEGAAAFLIDPHATQAGSIFRPSTDTPDTLAIALTQITQIQMSPTPPTRVWSTGFEKESSTILSALTADPKDPAIERQLDSQLGNPGPASGWIALAIAMEAMRGSAPQLVAWREPASELLHLCVISPVPQEEATV